MFTSKKLIAKATKTLGGTAISSPFSLLGFKSVYNKAIAWCEEGKLPTAKAKKPKKKETKKPAKKKKRATKP